MARRLPLMSQPTCGPKWSSFIPSSCPGWSPSRQCSGPFSFSGLIQSETVSEDSGRLWKILFISLLMTPPSAVPSAIHQIGNQQPLHSLHIWRKSQAGPTCGTCLSILTNLTISLCFSERTIWNPPNPPPIYFLNNPLEEVLSFKLLGLTICHDLSWESHIFNLASKASRRLGILRVQSLSLAHLSS